MSSLELLDVVAGKCLCWIEWLLLFFGLCFGVGMSWLHCFQVHFVTLVHFLVDLED